MKFDDFLVNETYNSLLIENIRVRKDTLMRILPGKKPASFNQEQAANYIKASAFAYSIARDNKLMNRLNIPDNFVIMVNKILLYGSSEPLSYRRHNVIVTGSPLIPPPVEYVYKWMKIWRRFAYLYHTQMEPMEFVAKQHILFESIHPFEDGNGRTGRIINNFFLLSLGHQPVILKGDYHSKKEYYEALECAQEGLTELTDESPDTEKVLKVMKIMKSQKMERLMQNNMEDVDDWFFA